MAREMIPCVDGDEAPTLCHFRCSRCGWSYSLRDGNCHYEEIFANALQLFLAHDCALCQSQGQPPGLPVDDSQYRTPEGFIVMCAHCRRTRRATGPPAWDWVPQYLDSTFSGAKISHGLCEQCAVYLYPETTTALRRAKLRLWLQSLRDGATE